MLEDSNAIIHNVEINQTDAIYQKSEDQLRPDKIERVLQSGIGHLPETSLPVGGKTSHTVLSGHRKLPSAKLFTDLDKMEKGDVFYIKVLHHTLAYQVDQILPVKPTQTQALSIVEGKDYVTLLTCTPYAVSYTHLFGIHKIASFDDFEESMKDAYYHDGRGKVILETTIEGFEIGCAVMGNKELFAGSVDEIETAAPFFDYEGKYQMVDSHIYCPARISKELFEEARSLALKAYRAMNCKGMTRVDMFVTPQQSIVMNEVNTIPGFTDTSRYPTMMKEAGIEFGDLLDKLIAFALTR